MKRSYINKKSDKQKAKDLRELPVKLEILRRAKGHCERCGAESKLPLYPLAVHHKKIGADREEIKSVEDGEALCIICHGKRHNLRLKFSKPMWGGKK